MEIEIKYQDRNLDYLIKGGPKNKSGEGIRELLSEIEKSDKKISRISLSGETKSYTFSRQVYLLVNMLKEISDSEIFVNGKKTADFILPTYS